MIAFGLSFAPGSDKTNYQPGDCCAMDYTRYKAERLEDGTWLGARGVMASYGTCDGTGETSLDISYDAPPMFEEE